MFALDANKLILKIFEKSLNVDIATEIYKKIRCGGELTVKDAIHLNELLSLTDAEAINIFLS